MDNSSLYSMGNDVYLQNDSGELRVRFFVFNQVAADGIHFIRPNFVCKEFFSVLYRFTMITIGILDSNKHLKSVCKVIVHIMAE